jgi:hypothetical protein
VQSFLNSTRRSVSAFKKAHDEGRLKLAPSFQRNPVWTTAQKSYLIDSILRGYPIPELYIQESTDAQGNETLTVVDGQQRIRACLEFLEGGFSLTDKEAPNWPDFSFEELIDDDKKKLFGYNFVIRQLPDVDETELRAIFRRLNRNVVALNAQELRHATYWGPFISSMEALSDHEYWTDAGIFTANDIRRMLDIEFISELAIGYLHGVQNKKSSLEKWYATYEQNYPARAKVEACFNKVLGELSQVLPELHKTRWRKKSDFYSLFLVFAAHEDQLPLTKTGRSKAQKSIMNFGADVDLEVSLGAPHPSKAVKKYVDGVEKAASDLAQRTKRQEVLEELLKPAFA